LADWRGVKAEIGLTDEAEMNPGVNVIKHFSFVTDDEA
jgi:hypothetical protein